MPDPADEGGLMNIEEEIARAVADAQNTPFVGSKQKRIAAALMPLVKRAQAVKVREVADLVMDPRDGLPFDGDHDLAIVSAWLEEVADRIEKEEVSDDE